MTQPEKQDRAGSDQGSAPCFAVPLTLRRDLFMADNNRQQEQYTGNGAAEVVRRGVAAARAMGEAAQQAAAPGTEAVQQAGAEVIRKAADTAGRGSAAVAEEAQR